MAVRIALGIWIMTGVYYFFLGVTTKPFEGDSLAYHLPLARIIADGKILDRRGYTFPGAYFPGMGEAMAAVLMKAGIPLNLFNFFGWIMLFGVVRKIGKELEWSKGWPELAAAVVCMWPSVLRLLLTQTVDIWVGVWWGWAWLLLMGWRVDSGKLTVKLGLATGLLIGTKISGILYLLPLLIIYGRNWSIKKLVTAGLVAFVIGGSWYVRNWAWTGNPVYPSNIFGLPGMVGFRTDDWVVWKTLVMYKGGWSLMAQALTSEYLLWGWGLLLVLWKVDSGKWRVLAGLNFLVYLFLPSWPENTLSDLRYAYPVFIPVVIAAVEWARKKKREEMLAGAMVLMMAAVLTQLDYRPKLWVGVMALWLLFRSTPFGFPPSLGGKIRGVKEK